MKRLIQSLLFIASLAMTMACGATPPPSTTASQPTVASAPPSATTRPPAAQATPATTARQTLRLATTTSTADSGLLTAILPEFEKAFNAKVDVVAVGTGQALEIGSKGDADVVLVHARAQEDAFVRSGFAKERFDVMYNDFILVGPKSDPAKVGGKQNSKEAFKIIMDAKALFVSRGDRSGTNTKELSIWASLAVTPTKELAWYNSIGQGMGETLLFANEKQGYTLADRGTYLSLRDRLPSLMIVVGGNNLSENKDPDLLNPYGLMAVNPEKFPGIKADLATRFVAWMISLETQKLIGAYGADKFGQPLFYPDSAKWRATR